MMFTLFVSATLLKYLKTLDATVHMLYHNPVFGYTAIVSFLQLGQFAFARLLERNQTKRM
jgi:hypothetical protein